MNNQNYRNGCNGYPSESCCKKTCKRACCETCPSGINWPQIPDNGTGLVGPRGPAGPIGPQGPAVAAYYESDMNWTLHLLLKTALERYGIEVRLTRETQNTEMDAYERGTMSKDCDLFLSLHSNAVGSRVDESVDYVVVFVP